MADERENIRPPEKSLTPGQKPDAKVVGPTAPQKEVPIGFGVITPEMERYRSIIAKDPSSRVFAALAELYRKAGMLDEAVRLCLNGTKAHPKYMSGRVALARAYFDKAMIKEAKEEVLTVVSITPDNILANKILGEIHLLEGDSAKAAESFTKVLALAPDDAEAKEKLLEAQSAPQKPGRPEPEAEDILDADILEEVTEAEPSETVAAAAPPGPGDAAAPVGREDLPFEAAGKVEESGDLDIPLEDEGSLDALYTDETADSAASGADTDAGRRETRREMPESEQGRQESPQDVGYVPDEETTRGSDRDETGGDIDIAGDQELSDEFGILDEDEGEITVEGLDDSPPPVTGTFTSAPRGKPPAGPPEPGAQPTSHEAEHQPGLEGSPDAQGVTITTETIADIYVKQGYFDRALAVYEELLGSSPGRDSLKQKIAFVKNKIREMSGDEQQQPAGPVEGGDTTPAAGGITETADDRKLQENVESLNRWLLAIRKLRRV